MDRPRSVISGGKAAPIAILGVPFDNVSTGETIELIEQMIHSRQPHYLATANVDFLVQAARDVELRRILFDAHLVLCDGTPLIWASKLLGNPLPERVAGSDLVPLLLETAAQKGYRPFFLGATPDSIEAAVENARRAHPGLQIAGYYSPPFNRLLEMDHEQIRERILEARPDLLFVGFGCPKQEKWINMHYRSLGVPVSVGVGGTIDFLAGKLSRAPLWMQRSGTEWIYRLAQEPRRLAWRYTNDLWHFGRGILSQSWQLRSRSARRWQPVEESPGASSTTAYAEARLPARIDFEEVHSSREEFESLLAHSRSVILDGSAVEFIDSTGVGLLIRLQKRAHMSGHQLVIASPSEQLRRALRLMRLEDFFMLFPGREHAEEYLARQNRQSVVLLKSPPAAASPALAWNGELTAANAEETWEKTAAYIRSRSLVQRELTIDLSNLRFIDSSGLGVMIRAKKLGVRQGVNVRFSAPTPNVANVIRLSRLEEYLLNETS